MIFGVDVIAPLIAGSMVLAACMVCAELPAPWSWLGVGSVVALVAAMFVVL